MKHTIKGKIRRVTGGYLYYVESKPNWFERIVLRKEPAMHELAVPKKVAGDMVATAKLIHHYLENG